MPSFRSIRRLGLTMAAALALGAGSAEALPPRSIGSVGGSSTIVQPPAVVDPPAQPAPPLSTVIGPKTSTTMTLVWTDGSAVEDGYRIERQNGTTWSVVAQLPAVAGFHMSSTFKVSALTHNTQYCFRVVPFNAYGAPAPAAVCATTTRVTGPITVVVSDLQGLQGELEDLSPLVYQPPAVAADPTAPAAAPPAPPAFPIPAPRKIVYVADSAVIRIPDGALFRLQQGLHLMSGRSGLKKGALLYSDAASEHTMITVAGDGVRISGLRLRGPSAGTDENLARAVGVYVRDVRDVVIDHNEFSQWTEAGVKVQHAAGLLQAVTAGRVRITENYFHENQRRNLGYGIVLKDASYAYIDKNSFDWNRHAVATDGGRNVIPDPSYGPEQGYLAYLNLILPGHSDIEYVGGAIQHDTHHFDVHGTESNALGVDYYDGWAGEFFEVANNSFLGTQGTAFNVRGTPSSYALFHDNVTPPSYAPGHTGPVPGLDGGNSYYGWWAVNEESDRDNVQVYGNRPSPDPRSGLGVGDFDGDGRDDVLLATGRAWYVSYGGVTEWRFLCESDRYWRSLWLGDLDGNGRTDVASQIGGVWHVSWNGSGALVPLGGAPALPLAEFSMESELVGDFTRDGVFDTLHFDIGGDRYFHIENGQSGATSLSRHQM